MEIHKFSCLLVLLASASAPPPSQTKQYRVDYVYNKKTDAFYKLHIESRRGWQIKDVCQTEGANAMIPASDQDIMQAHAMFKQYTDLGPYMWIASDGQAHESAEEEPLLELDPQTDSAERGNSWNAECDVMTRHGEIDSYPCYHQLPFICKVEAKDAPYDSNCGVFGINYVYYPSVGSCYKIPRIVFSWNQAFAECRAEGAHLAVINSVPEHDVVKNLTNTVPKLHGARFAWFFFAGFRADRPTGNDTRVFRTIFNQTLEEAGYNQWTANEPNNHLGNEYCGTIFSNDGNFNDVDCSHEYGFICEKEVHT